MKCKKIKENESDYLISVDPCLCSESEVQLTMPMALYVARLKPSGCLDVLLYLLATTGSNKYDTPLQNYCAVYYKAWLISDYFGFSESKVENCFKTLCKANIVVKLKDDNYYVNPIIFGQTGLWGSAKNLWEEMDSPRLNLDVELKQKAHNEKTVVELVCEKSGFEQVYLHFKDKKVCYPIK